MEKFQPVKFKRDEASEWEDGVVFNQGVCSNGNVHHVLIVDDLGVPVVGVFDHYRPTMPQSITHAQNASSTGSVEAKSTVRQLNSEGVTLDDIIRDHFDIKLSKVDREHYENLYSELLDMSHSEIQQAKRISLLWAEIADSDDTSVFFDVLSRKLRIADSLR